MPDARRPSTSPSSCGWSRHCTRPVEPFDAEAVLLAAREHWHLFTWWQTLPHAPVLSPGLRPVVTARVQEAYLTLPVGLP